MSKKRKLVVENGKGKRCTETSYERQRETVSKSSLGQSEWLLSKSLQTINGGEGAFPLLVGMQISPATIENSVAIP